MFKGCTKNPAEKAMACEKCGLLLCKSHTENQENLKKCPNQNCGVEPLKMVDTEKKLPVRCQYCKKSTRNYELNDHIIKDCTMSPHCYFNGCDFRTQNEDDALNHIKDKHGKTIWNNFESTEIAFVCKIN